MEERESLAYKASLSYELKMVDTEAKFHSVMKKHEGDNVRIAYSGGSDSDCLMWLSRLYGYNVTGVFYDTGMEYKATKDHLNYMRDNGFTIEIAKSKHSIPWALKNYGYPFISKNASELLHRLQRNNFKFKEDGNKTYEELIILYPRAKGALSWWTNHNGPTNKFNIERNRGLKEYLIKNDGLPFKTSVKCCDVTKKNVMHDYSKENNIQLVITGIRKAEGGRRATKITSCYLPAKFSPYDMYYPLFWWKNEDKARFIKEQNIKLSDCYETYGMSRTGCIGCPFGRKLEEELDILETYEPKLHRIATTIFKKSYDSTREYRQFVKEELPLNRNGKRNGKLK